MKSFNKSIWNDSLKTNKAFISPDNNYLNNDITRSSYFPNSNLKKFPYFDKINNNTQLIIKLFKLNKTDKIIKKFNNALFNINIKEENKNDSLLHISIINNNKILFKWLIKKGINLNLKNKLNRNCLLYCVYFNNFNFFIKLIKLGININDRDTYGNTCFHYICYFSRIEFLIEILKTDIDLNILNNYNLNGINYIKEIYFFNIITLHPKYKDYIKICGPIIHKNKYLLNDPKKKYLCKIFNNKENEIYNQNQIFMVNTDYIKNYLFFDKFNLDYLNLEDKLGEGSFGVVYLVTHKINNEKYAMKVFKKKKIKEHNLINTLKTEKLIMENHNNPFLMKCFYNFESTDNYYFLMEYCKYGDLNRINKIFNGIKENSLKLIICELLIALKVLHKNNILHRDIKPHNIVFNKDGHVRLTDFGLSKLKTNYKKLNSLVGSYAYMSPEMILGKTYDRTLDYYMLGITLIELLNGINPFYTNDLNQLKFQILYKKPIIKTSDKLLKNLLSNLVTKNKRLRLGYNSGVQDIMSHEYFKDINWKQVKRKNYKIFEDCELLKLIS